MKPIRLLLAALIFTTAACVPRTPQPGVTITPGANPTAISTSTPIASVVPSPTSAITPARLPASPEPSAGDVAATARHQRIFEQLWNTVNTQYVYPDFNGVDWGAAYDEFKPHIDSGLSDDDFWLAMAEMIARLDDGHSAFLTPSKAREQDDQLQGNLTYVGVGLDAVTQVDKGQAVIFSVIPNSPAEEVGLRPHDAILAIDGRPVLNLDGSHNLDRIRGLPGTQVALRVKSPGRAPREVTIVRRRIDGTLPVTGRILADPAGKRIGYMMIPSLWDAVVESSARQALSELMVNSPLDGLILDMRINAGGVSSNLLALLGFFTSGQHGEFASRDQVRPLIVTANPIGNSQDVPLIILVSPVTVSYAEVFSGVLRDAGRARIVGMTTAGNIETIYGYDFEDGSRAWIARETFVPPSGDHWENAGIAPDTIVDVEWDEFTQENDPGITAGVELLTQLAGAVPPR